MVSKFEPRILAKFTVGGTTYRFATDGLYDPSGNYYKGTLLQQPTLRDRLVNRFWGGHESEIIKLIFGNRDGAWHTLIGSNELRNLHVTLEYYDPSSGEEPLAYGDGILIGLEDGSVLEAEAGTLAPLAPGSIKEWSVTDIVELTMELRSMSPLETVLPKKLVNTTDFPNATDLGAVVNIILGNSPNTPLPYIDYNYSTKEFDYLIGYGVINSVVAVYRDGTLVDPSLYTVYDGSQGSPHGGYAFIRFTKEQRDHAGGLHTFTADVNGYTRSFAYNMRDIFNNSTWGLGESVDTAAFAAAHNDLNTIGDMFCDGAITTQRRAQEIIDDLAQMCRGFYSKNTDNEWTLAIDKEEQDIAAYFGAKDGYYNNVLKINSRYCVPMSQATKSVTLQYGKNDRKQSKPYYENYRSVFSFGVAKLYETDFVQDHTCADKVTCYLAKLAEHSDEKLDIDVGMDGKDLAVRQVVSVNIPRFSINGNYRIEDIEKKAGKYRLLLSEYSSSIYNYSAGSMPSGENIDDEEDYRYVNPPPPT